MGVKKKAQLLAGRVCPEYISISKKEWKKISKGHERIVRQVMSFLESKGYRCHSECEVGMKTRGYIDVLCIDSKRSKIVIVEIKSYDLYNSNRADMLQVIFYHELFKEMLSEKGVELSCDDGRIKTFLPYVDTSNIESYLAYRYDNRLMLIKVPQSSIIRENLYSINVEYSYTDKKYVIGTWCKYCNNSDCPFKGS